MKYIFKFLGVVIMTLYVFIVDSSYFIWDFIWSFKLENPFLCLELSYNKYPHNTIYDFDLNYQPEKSDNVIYEEYKTTFHYIWGFKPLKVKYEGVNN